MGTFPNIAYVRILMVMSHPDDEVIFGWPALHDERDKVSLLTMSNNYERHGNGPIQALEEVCDANNITLLEYTRSENNYYRVPPRFQPLTLPKIIEQHRANLAAAIKVTKPDFIFTHNPWGEYGHGDHRFTFNLVSQFPIPLLMTDICFSNKCHLSSDTIPEIYAKYLYKIAPAKECSLNMSWYNSMKAIYEKHNAWTWGGHDPVKSCYLYLFA